MQPSFAVVMFFGGDQYSVLAKDSASGRHISLICEALNLHAYRLSIGSVEVAL